MSAEPYYNHFIRNFGSHVKGGSNVCYRSYRADIKRVSGRMFFGLLYYLFSGSGFDNILFGLKISVGTLINFFVFYADKLYKSFYFFVALLHSVFRRSRMIVEKRRGGYRDYVKFFGRLQNIRHRVKIVDLVKCVRVENKIDFAFGSG